MTTAFSGLGQTTGTAAERVALVSPQVGQLFFETDTTLFKVWTGSSWITTLIGLTAGGDLTGTYPNPTLASSIPTNLKIANASPTITIAETTGTAQPALQLLQNGSALASEGAEFRYDSATGHSYLRSSYSAGNLYLGAGSASASQVSIDPSGVITTSNLVQRDTGWTNMNLTTYDANWTTGGGQYRKMPDGLIVFRGLVKIANSGLFFTMPAGYRPNGITNTLHGCPASGGIARIDAYSNGQLVAQGSQSGSVNMPDWVSLGGIIYWAG